MMNINKMVDNLHEFLEERVTQYNRPGFIKNDPIQIPHSYSKKQDVEITAFWTSMLAWGQRVTIINKSKELFGLMGDSPHDFMVNHTEEDRAKFLDFKHRTFQATDTLYFLAFFQQYYRKHESLETAFSQHLSADALHVGQGIAGFHDAFFALEHAPKRTRKHIATPIRKSTCKRMNMFLRWMVRKDDAGVDFGLWQQLKPSQLLMPLDVHVDRVARSLGLIERKQTDWQTVLELTECLRAYNADDPVRYDYALFGMGVEK